MRMTVDARAHPERARWLRLSCLVMTLLLLAQFLLGMVVNLFVAIPKTHPGAQPSNYFTGSVRSIGWAIPDGGAWLAVHAVLGMLLILGSVAVGVLAIRGGGWRRITCAGLGFAAILGAAFNGASFLDFGKDFSSMIMAALAVVAVGCYVIAMY